MERKCRGSLDPSENPLYTLVRRCPICAWDGRNNPFVFLTWHLCSVKHLLYHEHDKLLPREWYGDSKGIKQAVKRALQWHNPAVGPCAGGPGSLVAPRQGLMASPAVPAFPKGHSAPSTTTALPEQASRRETFVSRGQNFPTVATGAFWNFPERQQLLSLVFNSCKSFHCLQWA